MDGTAPVDAVEPPRSPSTRWSLLLGYVAVVALQVLGRLDIHPYDDAWFFKRFARNLLEHGVFAWNPADGPVYGNTSQILQLLAVPLYALAPEHTAWGTRLMLAGALVAGLALALRQAGRGAPLVAFAFCTPMVLATAVSGMETALVLAGGVGFLGLLGRPGPQPLVPLAMVVLYLLRPDTLLLTTVAWVVERLVVRRCRPLREGALLVAGLGITLLALRGLYGTALPLSFYAKSTLTSAYDPTFLEISAQAGRRHLAFFGVMVAPLLYAAAHRLDRAAAGPLLAAAAFVGYHLTSTVDVMGMHARFYAPALPFLLLPAARGWEAMAQRPGAQHGVAAALYAGAVGALWWMDALPGETGGSVGHVSPWLYLGVVGAAAAMSIPGPRRQTAAVLGITALALGAAHPFQMPATLADSGYLASQRADATSWRGVEHLGPCLGEDLTVYHSEIGVPGALLPRARIVDLAGLMSPEVAFRALPFEDLCRQDQPEALFLPHRNYRALNQEIRASACYQGYVRVVRRSSSALHIRADLAPRWLRCRAERVGG